ncbi:MFS general substrate transporter [Auriscalpium vulgare]|uniref:MFS general substrate transporter n=1 Tax=Auriscalpium vulgare TaxID=40419 RepID=A0ACB8SD20_9AGAM|nr:MFS general substrate transporter [Auriscalpium vulgare]
MAAVAQTFYTDPLLAHPQPTLHDNTSLHDDMRPLLARPSPEDTSAHQTLATPLPKAQLVCLCIVRVCDPIAFTQIFPYINEMIADLHITDDPSRVGLYSGLTESAFAVAQLCCIYQWAKLSDVVGRRPVIFLGVLGMTLASAVFGLSRSLASLLIIRCIAGLFSGNIAVIHSVLGELTDSTNQAVAFPIYGLSWPLGAIIGPLLGGSFSHPATKLPSLFNNHFFRAYPHFLPGFITAIISFIGLVFGYIFLEETLPSKRRRVEGHPIQTDKSDIKSLSVKALLSIPVIRALSLSGSALSFISTAFDVLFVLFCYSPIESGGLAFSAIEIGFCLASAGVISVLIQLLVTPVLLRRCDHVRLYNACMSVWLYCFALLPLINVVACTGFAPDAENAGVARTLAQAEVHVQALVWMGLAVILAISKFACLAYAISMILVKESAPSAESLGATNGLVQFAMCFARAISPAFVSAIFAMSLDYQLLGGYLWAVAMVIICLFSKRFAHKIQNGRSSAIAACDSGLIIYE